MCLVLDRNRSFDCVNPRFVDVLYGVEWTDASVLHKCLVSTFYLIEFFENRIILDPM